LPSSCQIRGREALKEEVLDVFEVIEVHGPSVLLFVTADI
jgi:hypothetical protein